MYVLGIFIGSFKIRVFVFLILFTKGVWDRKFDDLFLGYFFLG